MSVLPFFREKSVDHIETSDWSQQELAEFCRVHNLLNQHGVSVDLDRGLTDRSEPWAVFVDYTTEDVLLHIARLSGKYILVSETIGLKSEGSNLRDTINVFEDKIFGYLDLVNRRHSTSSNVIAHPSSKFLFILASLLLIVRTKSAQAEESKEPNSTADSKDKNTLDDQTSTSSRLKVVINKLHDLSDNPHFFGALVGAFASFNLTDTANGSELTLQEISLSSADIGMGENSDINKIIIDDEQMSHLAINLPDTDTTTEIPNSSFSLPVLELGAQQKLAILYSELNNKPPFKISLNVEWSQAADIASETHKIPLNQSFNADYQNLLKTENYSYSSDTINLNFENWGSYHDYTINKSVAYDIYFSAISNSGSNNTGSETKTPVFEIDKFKGINFDNIERIEADISFDKNLVVMRDMKNILGKTNDFFINREGNTDIYVADADVDGLPYNDVVLWTNVFDDGSSITIIGERDIMYDYFM